MAAGQGTTAALARWLGKEFTMRFLPLAALALVTLSACATSQSQGASTVKRETDAVVADETQHQKVLQAINAGATPAEAMAKAADGPKDQKPVPN